MAVVSYTRMADMTEADLQLVNADIQEDAGQLPDRLMSAIAELEQFQGPVKVSRLEHSLQSATRAHRAGKDNEYVAAALIHDIGDALAPYSHGEMVAGILRPFVSERICWIVEKHALFQSYYYAHLMGKDRNGRDRYIGPSLLRRLRPVLRALRPELLRPRLRLAAARILQANRGRRLSTPPPRR
jgi:predicted HD phosphohydrolase